MKKLLVGLAAVGMFAAAAMGQYAVDFEGAGETKTSYASATVSLSGLNWDMTEALIGTTAGSDWFNGVRAARMRGYGTSAMTMLADVAGGVGTLSFSYRRYGTDAQVDWKVEYSTDGGTGWTQVGESFTAPASDDVQTFSESIDSSGNTRIRIKRATETGTSNARLNIDDISMTSGGPATFGVTFDQTEGFPVAEGAGAAITATAANGTEPYAYAWSSTLDPSHYQTNVPNIFFVGLTAPLGTYTATVVATDAAFLSATSSISFSVVEIHPITITPPENGTVSTDAEDGATAGTTVTITATPAGGFAVQSIEVVDEAMNPVLVAGNTFTMPDSGVTVTVTFVEASASGDLIISQYYEGTSNNKWIEIYNPGATAIDLVAGGYRLAQFSNTNREAWKTDGVANLTVVLSNSIAAGGTYLVSHTSATNPAYAVAGQKAGLVHNGDDTTVLYTGSSYAFANVVDVMGWTADSGASDKSYVRNNAVVAGVNTDFNAADWVEFTLAEVDSAGAAVNERLGYHSTGPAGFGVSFDQTSGFEIEQGSGDVITATAANGTAPYGYSWSSTLGGDYYTAIGNEFTILATAPIGDYSAQVVATDSDAPAKSVTNSLNFSVVAPTVKYAIAIVTNAPANGTVTTTPATEAAAGVSVTVNATPAGGYAVESIVVNGGAVTVTGNAFTMPAEPVTVTVTFAVHEGSSLIISEVADPSGTGGGNARFVEFYNAGASSIDLAAGQWYLARQANGSSWGSLPLTGTVAAAGTYVVSYNLTNYTAAYPAAPLPNQTSTGIITGTGDDGYFLYSGGNQSNGVLEDAYGVIDQDGTGMPWEYTDARAVRNADVTAGNPTWTASEWTITEPAVYADMTPGVHPDGPVSFGVTFNKSSGFTVEEGTSDAVVATAANGVAPYGYVWTSSLGEDYRTAVDGTFTILATAPIGDYSAQVVATDSDTPAKSVTNSLNFSVVAPPTKYAISIVTNAPSEGTVTTTPATEAAAGVAVTVAATPAEGYAVESIVVNGGAVAVVGNAFTMPAEPATVTVTFMTYEAPDVLIDFEDYTGSYAWNEYVAGGVTWTMTNVYAGNTTDDAKNGTKAGRFENNRGGAGNPAAMTSTAFTQAITRLNFWYANYGVNDGGAFKVQVSDDGATWTDVGDAEYNPDSKILVQGVIDPIPVANATYVKFVTTAGSAQRVNIDDIGIYFGAAAPSLSYVGATAIQLGQTFNLTFTANGGSPGSWTYQLRNAASNLLDSGDSNVFSWQPDSAGVYYLTMNAFWAGGDPMATRVVTLTVTPVDPDEPAIVFSGSQTGTVGVEMVLAVTVTNATANEPPEDNWSVSFKDSGGTDVDWVVDNFPPTFAFTPAAADTYTLSVQANTDQGVLSNSVQLVVSEGGGGVWNIGDQGSGSSMIYVPSNRTLLIVLPTNYFLNAVYGADSSPAGLNNLGQGLGPLNEGTDYYWNPGSRTVTISNNVPNRRIFRIGATPP